MKNITNGNCVRYAEIGRLVHKIGRQALTVLDIFTHSFYCSSNLEIGTMPFETLAVQRVFIIKYLFLMKF